MSYVSPIFIESQVNSAFIMGLIFSFSSVVGIICDVLFPKLFTNQPHYFFLKATLLSAVIFPLVYLLFPNHILTFLIAMGVWGVYYELNLFSSFHFVHTYTDITNHSKTWNIISAIQSSAYAIAPIVAVELLTFGFTINFLFVCFLLGIAVILALLFRKKIVKKDVEISLHKPQKKSWTTEFKIWHILLPKVWHLLLLQIALTAIDAGFWTIGTLLSQEMSMQHKFGGFLITAYIAPAILVGFIFGKITIISHKKKLALITSAIAGGLFATYYFLESVLLLIGITAIASIFTGIAVPQLRAVFEDYISRLKDKNNEMIGLQGSSSSLAYVIGPIIATFLASVTGYKSAFSILGVILAVIALGLLFIIPKKIKMPQSELEAL